MKGRVVAIKSAGGEKGQNGRTTPGRCRWPTEPPVWRKTAKSGTGSLRAETRRRRSVATRKLSIELHAPIHIRGAEPLNAKSVVQYLFFHRPISVAEADFPRISGQLRVSQRLGILDQ